MKCNPIDFAQKFSKVGDLWKPRAIAKLNDYIFKVVKIKGDFVWHKHNETDEVFIVHRGELRIDFRDGSAVIGPGQMIVVPRGVEHKPFAEDECEMMLVEPEGTLNTGEIRNEHTVEDVEWI
jgi:mannose-6-phosphate isomerase-like protein (cupin superfamily)